MITNMNKILNMMEPSEGGSHMLCFRDMTFCVNSKCTRDCSRKLTDEVITAAHKWWGSDKAPIAQADFNCDQNTISGDLKCEQK